MINSGADSKVFEEVIRELLRQGLSARFQARGASMSPAIRDGEIVEVTPVIVSKLRKDDIVLAKSNYGFRLHRIVFVDHARDVFITRGDCGQGSDPALKGAQILGLARAKEVRVGRIVVQARFKGFGGWATRCVARGQTIATKLWNGSFASSTGAANSARKLRRISPGAVLLLGILAGVPSSHAQVAVDASTSGTGQLTTAANTVTFNHTTGASANLLLVGVAMNISNSTAAAVSGVTYNGTALTLVGAHNDAGTSRRVEMWYIKAPAAGTFPVVVSVTVRAGRTVGTVADATTFTGVDQTQPLGTFVSADNAGVNYSQLDVPSVVNGMVFDTLAIAGTVTAAVPAWQTQQFNQASGATATDVTGAGSTRAGSASLPFSETFSGNSNWSMGAISLNPSTADISVTTKVSAVALAQNSTYTITVANNGPSAANGVTLTDTFASTDLSLVSYTPSAGTTCTLSTTINCTLPTPFASGATATLTVVVSTTAPGYYPNTATVTDSGTPPDPNTGNNTYIALAPVVSIVCADAGPAAGGTLSAGVLNTYFPGTATVTAGATSIPIGAANGTGTIAKGSLLLVIQMQDASINVTNGVAYGNGYTGTGFTTVNNSGNYEFVTATGPVSGGSVPIAGAGAAGGLVFGYTSAAASASKGISTYQVVLVPQYTSATLNAGTTTAAAWNGSTGGILALDVSGALNLGGGTVSVNGLGFRGGAGMQLTGGTGSNADYWQSSPGAYTGAAGGVAGVDASKGEGVAGTPMWVESSSTFLQTTTGYPSGTAGTDGSMARGAPANAGGGGTDADPAANDQNAGGGGGGNGGTGGFGGDSWSTNLATGGEGGSPFPATIDRIAMGGGGGAGSRNNSDTDNLASSGSAGGGLIFIRANTFTGTATVTANGAAAYIGTANDAGGGGGAGGTIVMLAHAGGEGGLTLQANGGRGGDAWDAQAYSLGNRHGPGGGGAGGVVFVSGTPASVTVTGGANGTTLNPGVAYGATPGTAGTSATNATLAQVTGIQASSVCATLPDVSVTKAHVGGNFTRGTTATYTLTVQNVSASGATSGTVTVNDTLPFGITPATATGTGWTCVVTGQTISCTRSDALAAGASYPVITVSANVLQSAPATLINTGEVNGGGVLDPLKDTSTDTNGVISTADMSVTDAGSPSPVAAGGNITYTQVVTNNGPSAADNATLATATPANSTFLSIAAPAGWSCITPAVGGTGSVVCTNADMAALASATITLVVNVNGSTTNGTVISQAVSVGSSVSDPVSSNNTATVSTPVGATGPNLSVTNVASPVPVQASGNVTFTQVVTNTGSTAISNGTLAETISPAANMTFVSVTPPAGWTCTGFPGTPCKATTVAAGASGTFLVVYKVNAGTANNTAITNIATVGATNQSYGSTSAVATDIVEALTQADLVLSSAAAPATVIAGNNITYTQTVTNNGPAAATTVSFTQTTPAGTNFQSVLAPAGWTCTTPAVGAAGTITCNDASLAATTSANIIVVLNVPATTAAGTITQPSSVTATNSPTANASASTTVSVQCDLTVTSSGAPSPVTAGSNITYTQTIYNHGPSNCSTGALTEATPTNTTFVSVGVVTTGGGTWTCGGGPVSCTNPSVPPGSTGTITAVYTVNAGTPAGTIISDFVLGTTTSRDTNTTDNYATVNIAVTSGTQADLSVTNSATPTPVTAGNNITYTQTVTNSGPATANAPTFTETLPANTTAVSLTSSSGWTCGALSCTAPSTMASGTTANFTFVVKVNTNVAAGTTITQTDSVASTTSDPNSGNNSATIGVQVADSADLSVTNTPNPVPVQQANTITYTQVVNNAGPTSATSVSLINTLPPNATATSLTGPAGWTCTLGTLTCTDPSLSPGSPATITYVVTLNAVVAPGTAENETATVSSTVADPNSANNVAVASDVVSTSAQADLIVTNSASPSSVAPTGSITYTQTVMDQGPAAAAGASFSEITPPNTNFQSIVIPAGWTCPTLPVVGGTGTITCNDGSSLATGSANKVTFTVVLQAGTNAPSGTNITDTATATATNIVPSLTNNTASATVIVASSSSADMAIVKTATPNPVTEGTPLTYTLTVTNNGPASATNVTVADTLPSVVTYLSSTASQGSCSEAGGSVSCLLGTIANAGTATVTILTIPGQPGLVSNTATVSADQTDPNPANNSSTQNEIITAPTRITLQSFSARSGTDKSGANRTVLVWKTGGEAHNLGFNLYRDQNGKRIRVNPSLIAGSALLMKSALPKHAGRSYAWIDPSAPVSGASYWLEDVDVNGTRTMHGPVSVASGALAASDMTSSESRLLSQVNQALPPTPGSQQSHMIEATGPTSAPTAGQTQKQFELAAQAAVKIYVHHEGWHRIAQPDLVKAGLDPTVDPALLHLYAEAIEQPMQITGATAGPGGFGPQASIEFYGTGMDTVFTGTRVYWLVAGQARGARIPQLPLSAGSNQPPSSFPATVELQQHTIYFSALLTNDGQNFFGAIVSPTPVDQALDVPHLDATSAQSSQLEVALQGVITAFPHDVAVSLNGSAIGNVVFTGQDKGILNASIPPGLLQSGNNTVTLTAQNGDYDTSLVDYIRITYPHQYVADSDLLKFTGRAGDELTVGGFKSAPVVLDVTDPDQPVQLTPETTSNNGKYEIAVQVPFTSTNPAAPLHTLLALAGDRILSAAAVVANHPSRWHSVQPGADIAMVTYGEFASALAPLVVAHKAQGKSSAIVPVVELYDEFNFGERSPFAIKQFLQTASKNWRTPPTYLLLNGRASLDPRNYLGFGNLDLVPTRIIPTTSLMTASDDWFSDFTGNGMPTIATGRLPVSTADEVATVIGKITGYESQSTTGPWLANALMVADRNDTESFTQDSQTVQAALPTTMQVTDVYAGNLGTSTAAADIIAAINSGQALVNYVGHGSEEQWSGSDIFNTNSVSSLANKSQLPVFLVMDCLNGFFQDVYTQPLGVTLIVAPTGGAVAVLASTGLNQPAPQTSLDALVIHNALGAKATTLGDAVVKAKSKITDSDVRRTFVLFGDPAMQVKQPASN